MFLEFYKLREQPFGVTPDPKFLYFGTSHREALASLLYSIEAKRGFSALVAEPGMGKTSLLFRMLETLQGSARTAFLFQNEGGDSRDLLRSLLHDLGVEVSGTDRTAWHNALNEGLVREMQEGKKVVVVIDEAQNLDESVLETVRLLSNFETSTQKLMHIVLAGQPGLGTKLSSAALTQLRQRVSTLIRLEPLSEDEVAKYINHRLQAAGLTRPAIFSTDALEMISRMSRGIPRNINSICFQALSIGFATQTKQIGSGIIHEVVSDLDFSMERRERPGSAAPPTHRDASERMYFPAKAGLGAWDNLPTANPRYSRGLSSGHSRRNWLVAVACLTVVSAVVLALSNSKLELSDTVPGQMSERVVNAVLASTDPNSDFVPRWPDRLKPPPSPPPEARVATPSPETPTSDDYASAPSASSAGSRETPPQSASDEATQSTHLAAGRAGPAARGSKDAAFHRSPEKNSAYRPEFNASPASVQVLRSESVFQFAVEMYGHSNWTIVEAICAANPDIHDPYAVLKEGQRVRLPSDLVTVTATNSHAPMGRTH